MSEFISPINPNIEAVKTVDINKERTNNVWSVSPLDSRFDLKPFSHLGSRPASSPQDITNESLSQQTSDDYCNGIEATCSVGFKSDIRKSAENEYVSCAVSKTGEQDKWLWRYGEEACGVSPENALIEVQVIAPMDSETNVYVSDESQPEELMEAATIKEQSRASKIFDQVTQPYIYGPVAALALWFASKRASRKGRSDESGAPQTRRQISRTEAREERIRKDIWERKYSDPDMPLHGMEGASMIVRNATDYLAEKSAELPEDSNTGWIQRFGAARARRAYLQGENRDAEEVLDTTFRILKYPPAMRVIKDDRKNKGRRRLTRR